MPNPKEQLKKLAQKQKDKQKISDVAVKNVEKAREAARKIAEEIRQTRE